MKQHRIMQTQVYDAHLALSLFAQEFEIIYCQHLATRIHFVHTAMFIFFFWVHFGAPWVQYSLRSTLSTYILRIKWYNPPFRTLEINAPLVLSQRCVACRRAKMGVVCVLADAGCPLSEWAWVGSLMLVLWRIWGVHGRVLVLGVASGPSTSFNPLHHPFARAPSIQPASLSHILLLLCLSPLGS